jgi:hypothetical protein
MVFSSSLSNALSLGGVTEPMIRLPVTMAVPTKAPASLDIDPMILEVE